MTLQRVLLSALLTCLVACGDPVETPSLSVKVLYPPGGKGDRAFADSMEAGLIYGRWRFDLALEEAEPLDLVEAETIFETWLSTPGNGEMVITAGNFYDPLVTGRGCDYGGRSMVHLDASLTPCPDLKTVSYLTFAPAFLAGVCAQAVVDDLPDDVVGGRHTAAVLGGVDIPAVDEFIRGFRAGVLHAGGTLTDTVYISEGFDGFRDPESAAALARALYTEAVVVFPVAGGSSVGVYEEARADPGRFAVGVDSDQTLLGIDSIAGSVLKRLDVSVRTAISEAAARRFEDGQHTVGLRDGATEFLINPRFLDICGAPVDRALPAALEAADADRQ